MNKEILYVVDAVSNEKDVGKELIFEAVETALEMATRKRYGMQMDVRVQVDRQTGDYLTFRRWKVLDDEDPEFESPERQILLSYATSRGLNVQIGDYVEEPIDSVEFGRIAAQTAKQVIVAKVREAEREKQVSVYRDRVGELLMGTVKRIDRKGIFLDLGGNAEALIPREEMILRENAHVGARMRGFLKEIRQEPRGPMIIVSRTDVNFLIELMKLEVPEINQEMIEIMGAARDPGLRAKIAVRANLPNIDPVGACVGMRGSRIQTVTTELNGERVDIVLWDEDIATYVMNSMAPAEVLSIVVDEENRTMDIGVDQEKLSQAIGKGGQNVRLASELTGWILNVMSVDEAEAKTAAEQQAILELFVNRLDVDEEVAIVLVEEGFSTLEEVAYVAREEFLEIEAFDEEIIDELRNRARTALLTEAIAKDTPIPADDLLDMDGMDKDLAYVLAGMGIRTMEDLAEQSVDELLEIDGMDEERAGTLIMTARAPWFEDEQS
ncbi:MAG TPA: transcription termination factor NusA [Thiolinea sp.]|nr:transcription termination factor NusA [Thiolinea sp.]